MSNNEIGFGLLGAGVIAPTHANALRASASARLVGVADLSEERRSAVAGEFGCSAYASLDEMLEDPEVEVVDIILPNQLHYSMAMQALRAGKHVLVEKPPALSLAEIDEMIAVSAEKGLKVAVALQQRTRKDIQALRQAIIDWRFGKIHHADAYVKWRREDDYYTGAAWRQVRKAGAGVTIQQAIHTIDLLQYLLGPVSRVSTRMNNLAHPTVDIEDTLVALVDFQQGAQGVLQASTALWPGTEVRIEILGEDGMAVLVGKRFDAWTFKKELPGDAAMSEVDPNAGKSIISHAVSDFTLHQAVIEDLVEAIRQHRLPIANLPSVRPTMEWVLAMYKSARLNTPVDVPMVDPDDIW